MQTPVIAEQEAVFEEPEESLPEPEATPEKETTEIPEESGTTEKPEEITAAVVVAEDAGESPAQPAASAKGIKHPLAVLLGCLLFSSWMLLLISQLITIHRVGETFAWMWSHPEPVLLVCGVLTATGAVLWAVFRRLWLAFLLPGLLVVPYSVLN